MKQIILVLATSLCPALLLATPAHAVDSVASGACLTTYEAALLTDVTVNGPVHFSGGLPSVGNFTPSIFAAGATGPTGAFAACTV